MSSKEIPIINISISILRWRSTFEIQGNGIKGYWRVNGRDRSYGSQIYYTEKDGAGFQVENKRVLKKNTLKKKQKMFFKMN